MARDLAGKVVIITGGANGIGRATAERCVAEAARVVIADVDESTGAQVADDLGAHAAFKCTDVWEFADDAVYPSPYFTGDEVRRKSRACPRGRR